MIQVGKGILSCPDKMQMCTSNFSGHSRPFFSGLAPSQAPGQSSVLPACPAAGAVLAPRPHTVACSKAAACAKRRPAGKALRVRPCSRTARVAPWGPRGTPQPIKGDSQGAARRSAAGAQRAGDPIGCEAARPQAVSSRPAYSQWPPSSSSPRSPSPAYPRLRKRTRGGCLRSGWSFRSERRVR